jgi:hypothetical protein
LQLCPHHVLTATISHQPRITDTLSRSQLTAETSMLTLSFNSTYRSTPIMLSPSPDSDPVIQSKSFPMPSYDAHPTICTSFDTSSLSMHRRTVSKLTQATPLCHVLPALRMFSALITVTLTARCRRCGPLLLRSDQNSSNDTCEQCGEKLYFLISVRPRS